MILNVESMQRICRPFVSRRFLARLFSTFLCSTFIIARPFSKYGGPWSFHALVIKELVFSVQETLAQQLESTMLNLLGGFLAIAVSSLGKYLASLPQNDTAISRAILAIFLVFTCFLAGWVKSRLPRLTQAARICCLISIWLLTSEVGRDQDIRNAAINFVWVTLTAAITSLFSGMIFLHWTSPQFSNDVVAAFSLLHENLSACMDLAFATNHPPPISDAPMHRQLLNVSISLNQTYSLASFELRIGRVSVKCIKPLISTIEHLRGELSWGMSYPRHSLLNSELEEHVIQLFQELAIDLGNALLSSMKAVENIVRTCFMQPTGSHSLQAEKDAVQTAALRLHNASITAREELRTFCDELDNQQRTANGIVGFPQTVFDLCLFLISLLQMAHEMRHALHIVGKVAHLYEASSLRLWHPRLSWAWLGVAPALVLEEQGTFFDDDVPEVQTTLSLEETLQGLSEIQFSTAHDGEKLILKQRTIAGKVLSPRWICSLIRYLWNHPRILRKRLQLSRSLRSVLHSSHLRHAMKNAAGVALLSIPAFLASHSTGRAWFNWARGQWMVISFVWVLETNTGATWRVGYLRIAGTIIGCIYAYITWLICQTNPYGLVAMITLIELPISWIVINTSFPSLGVVASVTLPPLVFANYLRLDSSISLLTLTLLRGIMIAAGIVAALVMNSFIFPRHCRVMFLNNTSRTIGLLSQLYLALSRDLFHNALTSSVLGKQKVLKLELGLRNALHRMTLLIISMENELSLVPKPMQRYRRIISVLQKLFDLLTGLRKIREKIPRRETVTAVASQRREMVSCVCISLFACEQVFKARQPLPQFLPSMHQALHNLAKQVEERIRLSRRDHLGSLGLSMVYAFAEADVLAQLVDTLDELLDLSRQLFGISSWYLYGSPDMTVMTSMHEEIGQEM